jgi:menaquinol-cytochrome c reductase cytochrome b subunit
MAGRLEKLIPAPLRKPAKPGEGNGAGPLERAKEAPVDLVGWVDERTGASGFLTQMLYRKVPKGTNWFYTMGSATLFAFVVQAVTGVFLAMYYTPSATEAYASITHITNDVFLGEFVRGMHKWGATVMIIVIFLHMGRVFFFGAYKYPRELNWVIGVVLLILTLVMGLTGYLLPFDQRSFWATIVANNITASGPVLGPYLADFLRAGAEFETTTIARFYAIHMLLVPGAIIALIGAHLYLVVKLGTTAPPWLKADRQPKSLREEEV